MNGYDVAIDELGTCYKVTDGAVELVSALEMLGVLIEWTERWKVLSVRQQRAIMHPDDPVPTVTLLALQRKGYRGEDMRLTGDAQFLARFARRHMGAS